MQPLEALDPARFDTPAILKRLASSSRALAELKGIAASTPNQGILINTLGLQEAKDSSEIENIVTTHDELFKDDLLPDGVANPAAKEVMRYRQALRVGFEQVRSSGLITANHIIQIQAELERNHAGFRKLPGTALKDGAGRTVYTPPHDPSEIVRLMSDLERFMNDDTLFGSDPLIKMALIHHQFESIHPFSDGNGRIGRILCVLYLVRTGLLDTPVLYLSRYINQYKGDYYRLLQEVRDAEGDPAASAASWQAWVVFMLNAVAQTARQAVQLVGGMRDLMAETKRRMRTDTPKLYSQDLLNNLFRHPYTRIEFVQNDLGITRQTAARYLRQLAQAGLVQEHSQGKHLYFINAPLVELLVRGERGSTGI